jgi:hypothetical protein
MLTRLGRAGWSPGWNRLLISNSVSRQISYSAAPCELNVLRILLDTSKRSYRILFVGWWSRFYRILEDNKFKILSDACSCCGTAGLEDPTGYFDKILSDTCFGQRGGARFYRILANDNVKILSDACCCCRCVVNCDFGVGGKYRLSKWDSAVSCMAQLLPGLLTDKDEKLYIVYVYDSW